MHGVSGALGQREGPNNMGKASPMGACWALRTSNGHFANVQAIRVAFMAVRIGGAQLR